MSTEYLHDKVLASPDELILCVNYCLKEPEILKNKVNNIKYTNLYNILFCFLKPFLKM